MRFLFVRPEICPWLVCSHIRLPSYSTSRWTPLPSAISFPLPGGFGTLTLKKRAPPSALTQKSPPGNPDGDFHLFGHCRQNRSAYFYSFQVPSSKLFTLVYTIHVNYLAAAAFASLIFSVSIGTILFKSPTIP